MIRYADDKAVVVSSQKVDESAKYMYCYKGIWYENQCEENIGHVHISKR